jgi:hypothetical protein
MGDKKRLNTILDPKSFASLEGIKKRHGDSSYTQSIKRAIALTYFFDEKSEEGEFYLKERGDDILKTIVCL